MCPCGQAKCQVHVHVHVHPMYAILILWGDNKDTPLVRKRLLSVYQRVCGDCNISTQLKYPSVILHRNIIRSNGCVQAKERGSSAALRQHPL